MDTGSAASPPVSTFIMKYSQATLIACVSGATLASGFPLGQSTSQPSVERRGVDVGLKNPKRVPSKTPNTLGVPGKSYHEIYAASVRRPIPNGFIDSKVSRPLPRDLQRLTTGRDLDNQLLSGRAFDNEIFVRALNEELVERGVMSDGMDLARLGRSLIEERDFDEEMYARELEEELVAHGKDDNATSGSSHNKPSGQSNTYPGHSQFSARKPRGSTHQALGLPQSFDPSKSNWHQPYRPAGGDHAKRDFGLYDDLDMRDFDLDMLD
ncbi:hypothetical protein DXG03_009548 [Asterophora parasitica]|uniref:Uncharacterized protein n=1 Tax=Asterophora parasitica TaxID=117018 RepID=A0A9P7G6L4_9AGAR|nr:hypothetical protein DXG03_009548 [Asterophora parasitica]